MAKKRKSKTDSPQLKFHQRLVLNQWMLSMFEVDNFEDLAEPLRPIEREGLDENNIHYFHHQLTLSNLKELPKDLLLTYDENIVSHTKRLNRRRSTPIYWKYFQYLTLLFTEIYLDRFFSDTDKLRQDFNRHVDAFNADKGKKDQVPPFKEDDLKKLAYWSATGSGKTLLMHANIFQYQHYLKKHGKERDINRIILLTPNEGLSKQHLEEFQLAGIQAAIFSKDAQSLFAGKTVEIIDIHKLKETSGQKTVAIEAFEGKNLVLVDEGHRGASKDSDGAWMNARNQLCEDGFSFEYSATFGQAVKGRKNLEEQYARNILFDYSYKYFYKDGFGKDYRILNLADDSDVDKRKLYLTACLLSFYQQQRLFEDKGDAFRPFLLEKPLLIFVGGRVNAVRTVNKRDVSDVIDVLIFLADFLKNKSDAVILIERLMSGKPGLLDNNNNEIFGTAFSYLNTLAMNGEQVFSDILKLLFNASSQGSLHVENLKGADGEIALRVGDYEPFGLINVGDDAKLWKLCEEQPELSGTEKEFADSLFQKINDPKSTINILVGSKKFTEGWNSYRVSTMGLMNIGKKEGSEIIQLFGRGVRLKGHGMSLKRSSALRDVESPSHIKLLETLNIFGVRADYMNQFKEYLEEEGLPDNESKIEIILPVIKNLQGKKLKSVRIQEGKDFKRQGPKPTLGEQCERLYHYPIVLDWYPKIQAQQSKGAGSTGGLADKHEAKLRDEHLAFMDLDSIWFELQRFKNERAWFNLNIPRDCVIPLLADPNWYRLYIPEEEMEFRSFSQVRKWQEIAVALLKKYADRYYKHKKQEWEKDFYEYHELSEDDPNFIDEYRLAIEQSQEAIIAKLKELQEEIESGKFREWSFGKLQEIWFSQHLYQPLLHFTHESVDISPVSLNQGEKSFVQDLKEYYEKQKDFFSERELFLLRNMSKGKGIGFFDAGNFYPDFILWIIEGNHQYISFVDPHGLIHARGMQDEKIQFFKTIKELERDLADPQVTLNSFIVSPTPFESVRWWGAKKEELNDCHVVFQKDSQDEYIDQIIQGSINGR